MRGNSYIDNIDICGIPGLGIVTGHPKSATRLTAILVPPWRSRKSIGVS